MSAPARTCTQPRAAAVVELADGIVEGPDYPIVPDGEYLAVYEGHQVVELRQFRGAAKLFLRLRLAEAGEHSGKVLFRAYRVRKRLDGRRFVLGRRSALMRMLARVLDVQARPDRVSLGALKRHLLRVRTRTVQRDCDQRELPVTQRYSVVDDVLGKETS